MRSSDAFPSQRLKAEDIKGHKVTVTIENVVMGKIGDEEKPEVSFEGKDKTLILNRTNWNRLAEFLGSDESDDWIGCRIVLGTERVDFAGKRVDAIRVMAGEPKKVEVKPEPDWQATDDEVPF